MAFIRWEKQDEIQWKYGHNRKAGEQWGYNREMRFITNGRGEGFHIHGGTKYEDICAIVNALNKRDWEISFLRNQIKGG